MVVLVAIYLIMGLATVYLVDKLLGAIGSKAIAPMTNGQRTITAILWPIFIGLMILNFIWGYISGLNNRK
tara:strand:+ start:520 stop:729 length:210 start_codon:yes stop_codon:yes gene_type:complete